MGDKCCIGEMNGLAFFVYGHSPSSMRLLQEIISNTHMCESSVKYSWFLYEQKKTWFIIKGFPLLHNRMVTRKDVSRPDMEMRSEW